jgi:hypothetical protein
MFLAAIAVIEDPEIASLIAAALLCFRESGYGKELWRNYTIKDGRVCFSISGEAEFCFCPELVQVVEVRRY